MYFVNMDSAAWIFTSVYYRPEGSNLACFAGHQKGRTISD